MRGALIVGLLLTASSAHGAFGPDVRPQQQAGATLPLAPARTLRIAAQSGTWMSLDVAPDGRSIIFDMLGDLYRLPIAGGRATQLTSGLGFDTQPTFSRDGQWIAFVSDRSGADNLWVIRADGKGAARQITFGSDDTTLTSPAWAADDTSIFVSHYRADLNNFALLRYALDGTVETVTPVRASPSAPRDGWQSTIGAVASTDGKYLYFARRIGGLDYDELDSWTILRRDLATGTEVPVVTGPGSRGADHDTFFRPALAPDGRHLAYATRRDGQTMLRLRDLATGDDRALPALVDPDQLQAAMWQDILPRYAFTPDGNALLISQGGGFERVELASGAVTRLPFAASMKVAVGPSTRLRAREDVGPVKARLLQAPIASPDGRRLAFSAIGDLYVQDGGGKRLKLATGADPAFQPSWSPDGTHLVYVSWSEQAGGTISTIAADGSGAPVAVSTLPAYYSYPVFTPDGATIIAVRSAMAARQQTNFEYGRLREADLVALPTAGGTARVLTHGTIGSRPQFTTTPGLVYILGDDGLNAVDLASGARLRVAMVKGPGWYFQEGSVPVDDLRISPDGKWLLAQIVEQLTLVAMPPAGAPLVDLTSLTLPQRRLSGIGADYFEWRRDGSIDWSVGARIEHLAFADALPLGRAIPTTASGYDVDVSVPRARPSGAIVLRGARILTMAHRDAVIDNGDILIRDDRIARVGPRDSFAIPAGATVRDMSGTTIVPGFIDEHDHIGEVRRDVLSLEDWGLRARLAYGVTTSFDPSTLSIDMLAYQDLLDAGRMVGPRLRSTGQAIFSMNRFQSLDDVRQVQHRYRDAYGLRNIKAYRTGDRRVRQWMAIAAREIGLQPTTEGALSLKLDLTQILDGYAGNEHALAATPLGDDVIGLLTAMRTSYAATLMVTNTGRAAVDWFVPARDPRNDAKTRHFWPPAAIEQKLIDRPWQPLRDFRFPAIAADAARVAQAGGLIGMGAHGEVPGIGFHWEMEAHAMGGMSPMAVLHAATAGSAETIGRLDDLGTIEVGKLADLVVLERDPLTDIRNTTSVRAVMRGGVLMAGDTLDEVWPEAKTLPAPWFAPPPAVEHWLPAPVKP